MRAVPPSSLRPGPAPLVVVTRPEPEAGRWLADLEACGVAARSLPLLEIAPPRDGRALQQAWAALPGYAALFFVSGNAVNRFFASKGDSAQYPAEIIASNWRAWAPGPGSAAALRAAGVPAQRIDAPAADAEQFDSEALWRVVQPQLGAGQRVLIVRGAGADGRPAGRDWLARQLRGAGVVVDEVAAYERRAPRWSDAQAAAARAALRPGVLWLFSSSEAIANLRALLPDGDFRAAAALATHPRIALAARDAGFTVVRESRPTLEAVRASIESLR